MKIIVRTSCLIIIICLSCLVNSLAQETDVRFDRLSLEEGLSQSGVACILQDSLGFLWFGKGIGKEVDPKGGKGLDIRHSGRKGTRPVFLSF